MDHFDTPHTHHLLATEAADESAAEVADASFDDLVALARRAPRPRVQAALRPCLLCTASATASRAAA